MARYIFVKTVLLIVFPSILIAEKEGLESVHNVTHVPGQLELTGHFDNLWTKEELRGEIGFHCVRRGKSLVLFETGMDESLLGTRFVAVCQ